MQATLLGHACWLIEAGGARLLTDPVFSDPFEEGTVTACPSRAIHPERLPPLDALFISHRHLDHFHLPTLASLPHTLPVFCPDDPLLIGAMEAIGFTNFERLSPFSRHRLGGAELIAIPGVSDTFAEYGLAIVSEGGVLVNQVDTPMTGATIDRLRSLLGRPVDVHVAMFACQDFTYFEGKKRDLAELHATNLSATARLGAQVVVPGAAGFRFVDALGWLNSHLFPISAARFAQDLARLGTGQQPMLLSPGDQLVVEPDTIRVARQASPLAETLADDTHLIAHNPTAAVPALTDDNEHGYPEGFLSRFVQSYVGQVMPSLIGQLGPSDPVIAAYCKHKVVYRLDVVFPSGDSSAWLFRFDGPAPVIEVDTGTVEAQVRKQIAASALADVCGGRRGCFWMRTRARRSSAVFALQAVQGGLMVEEVELRDLLTHLILVALVAQRGEQSALKSFYGLQGGA